jgi:rhodanese-related sulfurtransferase
MKEISAQEAYELIESNPEYIYLDVRSVPEFEAGHPEKAINIPILHFSPGLGMTPNEDFPAVVEANLPKDANLVIGCKTGMRSARACDVLSQMGYTNVANVRGGFAGMTDNFGRLIEPGWSTLNLPTSTESADEARYETLAAKAKKCRALSQRPVNKKMPGELR